MADNPFYPTPTPSISPTRDRLLMDAGQHLRAAILALQTANETELRDKVFALANDVLHARQAGA